MHRLFPVFFWALSIGPTLASDSEPGFAGVNFLQNLTALWPEHENTLSLVAAVNDGNVTATYTVDFESFWSAATHPTQFPPSPHFSGLIGGSHHALAQFWLPGTLASPGMKSMAELGSKFPLTDEVEAAIAAGTAGSVLSGGGIGLSPDSVSLTFDIARAHPRVTLVSMIAPSPDWFVGVSGLSLIRDGRWLDEVTVTLYPYDAGTDSGPNYLSPNAPSAPPELIFRIDADPFLNGNSVPAIGTFTFTRISL